MRTKNGFQTAAVFLGFILFFVAPVLNAPSAAPAGDAYVTTTAPAIALSSQLAKTNPKLAQKPLRVWECVSSWYGEDFEGRPTATGETYDMFGVTAASPNLPLGSIVRVVNPKNHRSQIVRINDRGPYIDGRDLDVSYEVARRLGFDQRGLAKVRLELLEVPSRPGQSSPRPE